jgi:ParB-like chromosome segregation protein Spo0J
MASTKTRPNAGNLAELLTVESETTPEAAAEVAPGAIVDNASSLWSELVGDHRVDGRRKAVSSVYVDGDRFHPNPFQPRVSINPQELASLKKSFDKHGQLQTGLARPMKGKPGYFELASANRRLLAVFAGGNAGLKEANPELYIGKLRVDIRELTDEEMLDAAWDENAERENTNVFDKANYFMMVRQLESPARLSPVINANLRGAALTEDGLVSWEELYAIRAKKDKPLPPASTMRRIVDVLKIPEKMREALLEINFSNGEKDEDGEERFKPVSEKAALAVFKMPTPTLQWQLIRKYAAKEMSANLAMSWAAAEGQRAAEAAGQKRRGRKPGEAGAKKTGAKAPPASGGTPPITGDGPPAQPPTTPPAPTEEPPTDAPKPPETRRQGRHTIDDRLAPTVAELQSLASDQGTEPHPGAMSAEFFETRGQEFRDLIAKARRALDNLEKGFNFAEKRYLKTKEAEN